jgi:multidrug efflux pump subunit AcrA (membrane-fusion protein)
VAGTSNGTSQIASPDGKRLSVAVLTVGGLIFGAFRLASSAANLPTTEVKRKEFVDHVEIKGEVKAIRSAVIAAPYAAGDLQILRLVANATKVKKGDFRVECDPTTVKQKLAEDKSAVTSAEAEIQQSRAASRLKEEQDLTDVMTAKYDTEKARMDASKQEILSAIEGEQAKLKLADAEQKVKETDAKLKADRAAAGSDLSSKKQKRDQAAFQVAQMCAAWNHSRFLLRSMALWRCRITGSHKAVPLRQAG